MAEKRCEIEVTLEELVLDAAVRPRKSSRHLLGAALHWPRTGTPRRDASAAVTLEGGAWRAAGRPWSRRILLKEAVQGRFGFGITVSAALPDADADNFLRALASQFVKLTGGQAGDLLAPPLLGSLAELPLGYLAKALLKEKAPVTLGEGVLDLEAAQLPAPGGRVFWDVPLLAPSAVIRTVRRRAGKRPERRRETLLAAGAAAGRCRVEVCVL